MNKKILSATLAIALITPISAQAASLQNKTVAQPTIAILDTALDTSLPIFKDRVIFEACVTQWASCPNGQFEMEGPGSSTLKPEWISKNGFDHGTQIASIAVAANPNVKIVFVRIIGASSTGLRQSTGEQTVYNALDWVIKNKDRFNIQAVSMSQGHHKLLYYKQYCPISKYLKPAISNLKQMDIPVFFPTGNNSDTERIDWPSCIQDSIAVGATDISNSIATYSNNDYNLVDFYSLGQMKLYTVGNKTGIGRGTSVATQVAAANWLAVKSAKPNLTYQEIYDLLSRTSVKTKSNKVLFGKLINIGAAING